MSQTSSPPSLPCRIVRAAVCILSLAFVAFGGGGCVSLEHAFDSEADLEPYGGVTSSWEYISSNETPFSGTVARAIDLPLTVVMDTLLLPVSVPVAASR